MILLADRRVKQERYEEVPATRARRPPPDPHIAMMEQQLCVTSFFLGNDAPLCRCHLILELVQPGAIDNSFCNLDMYPGITLTHRGTMVPAIFSPSFEISKLTMLSLAASKLPTMLRHADTSESSRVSLTSEALWPLV
ncbi:hypothetical protein KCU74_g97, partial [Aureobasidium melanogenum]